MLPSMLTFLFFPFWFEAQFIHFVEAVSCRGRKIIGLFPQKYVLPVICRSDNPPPPPSSIPTTPGHDLFARTVDLFGRRGT